MIKLYWDKLLSTIWFVPTVISSSLVIAAIGFLYLDQYVDIQNELWMSWWQIGAVDTRQVIVMTATSIISVTGVVFSISIVALSLAASQFGSKILHNFLHDNKTSIVLGVLIGSFLYGLVLLVYIDTDTSQQIFIESESLKKVPVISVVGNLILTVLSIIGLIYFIHRISVMIQADQIIALIGQELNQVIEKTLLDLGENATENSLQQKWETAVRAAGISKTVFSSTSGYVEYIDFEAINSIAENGDQYIELLIRPGDFVIEHSPVFEIYKNTKVEECCGDKLILCISLDRKRTPFDDIEFAIIQLLQIALRALSPGVNDSLTAISCIDWLSSSSWANDQQKFSIELPY